MMKHRITEFLLFCLAALLILTLSSLPTWTGYSAQDNKHSFVGIFDDHPDFSLHIATMQAGIQGDWSYRMRFTTEEQKPVVMKMFYIVLGHISKTLHLQPETTYHLFRWIFGFTALLAIFLLCKKVLKRKAVYWSAFFLVVLGSGLGWLELMTGWTPAGVDPVDFRSIDAYFLYSIAVFPHFSFQITLMAISLVLYLDFLETRCWKYIAAIVVSCVFVQFVNPVSLFVVDIAFFFFTLVHFLNDRNKKPSSWLALMIVAVGQIPLLAYNLVVLVTDPVWRLFSEQNITLSPPLVTLLLGFAFLWPFAIIGCTDAMKRKDPALIGLAGWAILAICCAYLPLNIQFRFMLGLSIPLGILAARGFEITLGFLQTKSLFVERHRGSVLLLYILLTAVSTFYLFGGGSLYMRSQPEGFFYPASYDPALSWLKQNGESEDVVLGYVQTSLITAQKTGMHVYIGHSMETLHHEEKEKIVIRAYQQDFPESTFSSFQVDWIIYGPYEQAIAPDFQPGPNLVPAYQSADVIIYQVKR